jgi:hypothetical protein
MNNEEVAKSSSTEPAAKPEQVIEQSEPAPPSLRGSCPTGLWVSGIAALVLFGVLGWIVWDTRSQVQVQGKSVSRLNSDLLQQKIAELREQLDKLAEVNRTASADLEHAVTKQEQVAERMTAFSGEVDALQQLTSADLVASVKALTDQMSSVASANMESSTQLSKAVADQKMISDKMAELALERQTIASQAAEYSKAARESGKKDLALVYLVSGIRAEPNNIELLKDYADLVVDVDNVAISAAADELLQDSLFNVAPEHVEQAQAILEDFRRRVNAKTASGATPLDERQVAEQFLEEIKTTPSDSLEDDVPALEARQETIGKLLDAIDEDDPNSRRLVAESSKVRNLLQADVVIKTTERMLANLDVVLDQYQKTKLSGDRAAVVSALEATEAASNAIWILALAELPQQLRVKVSKLPEQVKTRAAPILDAIEAEKVQLAEKIWEDAVAKDGQKTYQEQIDALIQAREQVTKIHTDLRGPTSTERARTLHAKMMQRISELQKKQFAAYQKKAIETLEEARKRYMKESAWAAKDGPASERTMAEFPLNKIDQTLLSPESSQFYQSVTTALLEPLDAEKKAETQAEWALEPDKWKLADF